MSVPVKALIPVLKRAWCPPFLSGSRSGSPVICIRPLIACRFISSAFQTEGRYGDHHKPPIQRRQPLIPKAERGEGARWKVFDQDVRVSDQAPKDAAPCLRIQIERDALLVGVEVEEN